MKVLSLKICILLIGLFSPLLFAQNNQAEQETPLDSLYQILLNEILTVTTDKEVLLNDESAVVLSQGVWRDADVAAYKIKYKRLPAVLPLTKYHPDEEQAESEEAGKDNRAQSTPDVMQKVDSTVVHQSNHQIKRAQTVQKLEEENNNLQGEFAQSSGGNKRAEPQYTDDQKAEMIMRQGKASEVFYLYVNMPADEQEKQQMIDMLSALFEDDFQGKLVDNSFVRLPQSFITLWKVRLGLIQPQYPGGYR